jgi:hypothetical protein
MAYFLVAYSRRYTYLLGSARLSNILEEADRSRTLIERLKALELEGACLERRRALLVAEEKCHASTSIA